MFPEKVHYSRTDSPGWQIQDWETANHLLSYLTLQKSYYAIFELGDGSYIQCLGSKTRLTVEARVYEKDGGFHHYIFGKGEPKGTFTEVGPPENIVSLDESQVLRMRDAKIIIRQFLESRTFNQGYNKQDITGRFTE